MTSNQCIDWVAEPHDSQGILKAGRPEGEGLTWSRRGTPRFAGNTESIYRITYGDAIGNRRGTPRFAGNTESQGLFAVQV